MLPPDHDTSPSRGRQHVSFQHGASQETMRHDIDDYTETDPTVGEWLRSLTPTKRGVFQYFRDTFVFTQWVPRYNLHWMLGDSIAGVTVGFVVIPQALAYAQLAGLSPEYGLYTSFTGAALYWLFGTSKDIVIGTTAVGSLLVGTVVSSIQEQQPDAFSNEDIAKTTSFIAGAILLFIALLRLGWIIEFIPYIPISAFVTAASVTIMSTQFPTLMGIKGINTRQPAYLVIIDSLKGLPRTQVDAAIGLSSIVILYAIRYLCAAMEKRHPAKQRIWALASSLRMTFVMLLFTFISWLVNRTGSSKTSPFRIVGPISRGFNHTGTPKLQSNLILLILPSLPAMLIILVIEHIAIAKSFGRTFGYTVIPSQEMLAQGASNLLGPFLGGYVCTGSFGASAVLSKAAVQTPLAGLFSSLIVILALYALTSVFYYIPMAALAGLIIHAVANLPTPPSNLRKYWKLSPFELIIWVVGLVVAIFVSLEVSIYITICLSLVLLLVRQARTQGRFLGQVTAHRTPYSSFPGDFHGAHIHTTRDVYLPINRTDATNPTIAIEPPYPGVFIFRFPEGLSYINQALHMSNLITHIKAHTRPGSLSTPDPVEEVIHGCATSSNSSFYTSSSHPHDHQEANTPSHQHPDPGQKKEKKQEGEKQKPGLWANAPLSPAELASKADLPPLGAVILDCSSIDNLDITAIQGLVDARNALDKHAAGQDREKSGVEWYFAGLSNRWTRKALSVVGFGGGGKDEGEDEDEKDRAGWYLAGEVEQGNGRMAPLEGKERRMFLVDLAEAVDAAVEGARRKEGGGGCGRRCRRSEDSGRDMEDNSGLV